jgi:hypothetical protein
MRRVGLTRRHSCGSGELTGTVSPARGCVALPFAICLLWAMAQTFNGVREIECKDGSNHLSLVRLPEIQLARRSKQKREVRNTKKIKAAAQSTLSELSGRTCLYLNCEIVPVVESFLASFAFFTNRVRFLHRFRRAARDSLPVTSLTKEKEGLARPPAPRKRWSVVCCK